MLSTSEIKKLPQEQKIKEVKTISISLSLAKTNKEYWHIVQNLFREQAARIIQRQWRTEHKREFTGNYTEIIKTPLSLRFIKEPFSSKNAKDYADIINEGKYTALDTQHPQFIRNLYKALRLKLLTNHQMVTAILLHSMKEIFKGSEIKQYQFEEKGPFHINHINFVNSNMANEFKKQLDELPFSERQYFSVALSRLHTTLFLYLGLALYQSDHFEAKFFNQFPLYLDIFERYVQQSRVSEDQKKKLITRINRLTTKNLSDIAKKTLSHFLIDQEIDFFKNNLDEMESDAKRIPTLLFTKENDSFEFMLGIVRIAEEFPAITLSPHYDDKNPQSPVICFNLLTLSAFEKLQKSLFSANDIIHPYYTMGQMNTRFIRFLDEKPERYDVKAPARPVEIIHPDVIRSKTYHKFKPFDFFGTWHDLVHTWKCSLNLFKPWIRYLISIQEKELGFDMTKSIWAFVDRDYKFGANFRHKLLLEMKVGMTLARHDGIRFILGDLFWEQPEKHDLHLFYIIDMIIHYKKWVSFLNTHPNQVFKANDFLQFQKVYGRMEAIIQTDYKKNGIHKPAMFYILMYRLQSHMKAENICNTIYQLGIDKVLYWKKDAELYLKQYIAFYRTNKIPKEVAINRLSVHDLFDNLNFLHTQFQKTTQLSKVSKLFPYQKQEENLTKEIKKTSCLIM